MLRRAPEPLSSAFSLFEARCSAIAVAAMVQLTNDPFLNELNKMYERNKDKGTIWVTMKRSASMACPPPPACCSACHRPSRACYLCGHIKTNDEPRAGLRVLRRYTPEQKNKTAGPGAHVAADNRTPACAIDTRSALPGSDGGHVSDADVHGRAVARMPLSFASSGRLMARRRSPRQCAFAIFRRHTRLFFDTCASGHGSHWFRCVDGRRWLPAVQVSAKDQSRFAGSYATILKVRLPSACCPCMRTASAGRSVAVVFIAGADGIPTTCALQC